MTTIRISPAMIAREKFARLMRLDAKQERSCLYRDERFERTRLRVEIAAFLDALVRGQAVQFEEPGPDERAALTGE